MAIPISQLESWANQGAIMTAQATHASLRTALASYPWPTGVTHDEYLQGSYRNHTNIRGDSDVDLVTELNSVFWSNLTEEQKKNLRLSTAAYTWADFRRDAVSALVSYYGSNLIDASGSKSVKIRPASGRLPADVVIAGRYLYYENDRVRAEGITFWTTPSNVQVVNYPKPHFDNGAEKNSDSRTRGWFRKTVRVFKNARNRLVDSNPALSDSFPSYFVECLLYNVPDAQYSGGHDRNFVDVLNWLHKALYTEGASSFTTQSGMHYLFGPGMIQWSLSDARLFTSELIDLWNEW